MKIKKLLSLALRKVDIKPTSLDPKKREINLELGQDAFKGLSPFDIKQKMIILNQTICSFTFASSTS